MKLEKIYLEFINNVSEHNIEGKKLKELLLIKNNFPCWEMSLINENLFTNVQLHKSRLKNHVLEIWIKKNKFEQIYLFTDSLGLAKSIFIFAK